jgi:hypothetical protein
MSLSGDEHFSSPFLRLQPPEGWLGYIGTMFYIVKMLNFCSGVLWLGWIASSERSGVKNYVDKVKGEKFRMSS